MNNLETILQKLDSELGTIEAAWKTVLNKSTQSKNISLGEWNMLVDFASRTFSDISVLKTAVEEVINTIGTDDFTANVKTLRPTLVDALNSLTRMQLSTVNVLENLKSDKLDRIYLDENGNGADPTNPGSVYEGVGTADAVYVEHMGSDDEWRPMLIRANSGDTEANLRTSRIPITDSAGKLKVVAPDGTVGGTDSHNSAIPQHYADSRYVRSITSTADYDRAYVRTSGGANANKPISAGIIENSASIPIRDRTSQNFHVGSTTQNTHPINAEELISRLSLEYDRENYVFSLVYNAPKEINGNSKVVLGSIDLPMESVVVDARVDPDDSDYIYLKLINGNEVQVQIDFLFENLVYQSELDKLVSELGYAEYSEVVPIDASLNTGAYTQGAYTLGYDGLPHRTPIVSTPQNRRLVCYDDAGQLQTNAPTEDLDCANKKYVDDAVANAGGSSQKLYLHTINFGIDAWVTMLSGYITVRVLNTDPTNYTKDCELNTDDAVIENPYTAEDFAFLNSGVVSVMGCFAESDTGWYVGYPIVDIEPFFAGGQVSISFRDEEGVTTTSVGFSVFEWLNDTVTEVM